MRPRLSSRIHREQTPIITGNYAMTEQEILIELKLLKAHRKKILELKEQIAAEAANIASPSWTTPKVKGGTFISPQERYLERTERLNKELDHVFAEYEDLHYKMLNLMERLPPVEWTVILDRFFREMSMKRTAEVMEFTVNWVKDIQKFAIKLMSEYSEQPPNS